jgi:hypothetical protein
VTATAAKRDNLHASSASTNNIPGAIMSLAPPPLPAPLVPPEIDLRGYSSFMFNIDRLFASELFAAGTHEECWAAFRLWCHSFKQTPPSSLPADDRLLASFAGAGRRWPKIKTMALRGFILCSDGRLYHPVVAEQALKCWGKRQKYRNDQERLKRWRLEQRNAYETHFNGANETHFNGADETHFTGANEMHFALPLPLPLKKKKERAFQERKEVKKESIKIELGSDKPNGVK